MQTFSVQIRVYDLTDTTTGEVVGTYATHRRALNASNKIEPKETIKRMVSGKIIREWRYQISPRKL